MKKIFPDRIVNIENSDVFDNTFLFDYLEVDYTSSNDVEVVYVSELLSQRKNEEILSQVKKKPAMYSNVYSPKDELEIFSELFENAIQKNKKIHIVGVTLDEEIKMLEEYYSSLWYMREDINCFDPDFSHPLVTVSVKIENLMWKGSDYKAQRENIFFNPPVRESGQVKAMFKGINRGVIAGIYIEKRNQQIEEFLSNCIKEEKILPITLAKVLKYNLSSRWFTWSNRELKIQY